jgi:hypothetical protein
MSHFVVGSRWFFDSEFVTRTEWVFVLEFGSHFWEMWVCSLPRNVAVLPAPGAWRERPGKCGMLRRGRGEGQSGEGSYGPNNYILQSERTSRECV